MTQQQHDATMQSFVREWNGEATAYYRDGFSDEDLEAMYRSRCETSGINYATFCAKRENRRHRNGQRMTHK